jgi:hypothetical protein
MLGLDGSLSTAGRTRLTVAIAMAAITVLLTLTPSAAHAAGCENSWKNAKGGSWTEAENWSKKAVPAAGEEVCITEAGIYTVALNGVNPSIKSLVVGGSSGTQTLAVGSTCGNSNETLTTTAGLNVEADGALTLTNADSCGYNVYIVSPITNHGTVTTEVPHGGQRQLQGAFVNKGTLQIGTPTSTPTAFNGSKALLTNEGAIKLSEGAGLTASNESAITNGTGGSIAAAIGAYVYVDPNGTFTEGAGTTSGEPVYVEGGAIVYTGTGASTIAARATSSLSGNLSSGQKLELQSTCSASNEQLNVAASLTSAGTITMENAESCGYNTALLIAEGQTLTNTGTISAEEDHGGNRVVQGSLLNKGTLNINQTVKYDAKIGLLTNEGTINVANEKQLAVSEGSSVTNAAGTITSTGTGNVYLQGGTLTENGGKTSGEPVYMEGGAIVYTGTGASTIAARATSSLSGNLSSGQKLELQSTCSASNEQLNVAASLTSAGTITMENAESCGYNTALLIAEGQTLTNTGTISAEEDHGGNRVVQGSLLNKGTLNINQTVKYDAKIGLLTNEGTINVANEKQLAVSEGSSVTNAAGTITSTGTGNVYLQGGTLTENGGKTSGEPVYMEGGAIVYTGTGASTIAARATDTLTGNVAKGQTLELQSTCGASNEQLKTAGSFTNEGTIDLTNGDTCGYNAMLSLGSKMLTNKGTINSENPHGGARTIEGILKNEGTLSLSPGETLKVTHTYTQTGKGTLKTAIASASSFGALSVTSTAKLAGALAVTQIAPFSGTAGESFVVLGSSSQTGTFTKETGAAINTTGLYYEPTYSATGVTLHVTQVTLSLSPTSGAPGSSVTVSGSGYLPGDTITPTFIAHGGAKTAFPKVTIDSSGEFSTEITVPASAALGTGSISVKSMKTAVTIKKTFKVT